MQLDSEDLANFETDHNWAGFDAPEVVQDTVQHWD